MQVTISPSRAHGVISAPPSKSHAHRELITAALSPGISHIRNIDPAHDLLATMSSLRALGAEIDYDGNKASVIGMDLSALRDGALLPCQASGSTLRFLIPIALLSDKHITFTGTEMLMSRPLSVYHDICREQNLIFEGSSCVLHVRGPLSAGVFRVPGNISSQFISGLLFALPLLPENSVIQILTSLESRPYVRMTVSALRESGVSVFPSGDTISVPGNQRYLSHDSVVEGSWSGSAVFLALGRLGGDVSVTGLSPDSLHADRVCPAVFDLLESGSPVIDLSDCPDLGPVSMALSAALHGATFTGIRRLRLKESDRCAAMSSELAKFGVQVETGDNTMVIRPALLNRPSLPLQSHGDHRIVMALSVLASVTGAVIEGAEAVGKSMPDFFSRMKGLGIEVDIR
jgi:3-phosphoshikimate 1-carboxyvinyltransferase